MKWILVLWLVGQPDVSGTISTPNEDTCLRVLSRWESISTEHEGLCVYGNLEEYHIEDYSNTN